MQHSSFHRSELGAVLRPHAGLILGAPLYRGHWAIRAYRGDKTLKSGTRRRGALLWEDEIENLVVNAGLDYALKVALVSGSQITNWYLGLTDGSPTVAAADTLASHSGWTEVTAYSSPSTRATWTPGTEGSQSVDNSASTADFTINADSTTVGGAFLASADSGTSGTLYAAGAFSAGDKSLDDGDSLDVTATFTTSAS